MNSLLSKLNLPECELLIRSHSNRNQVWDTLRRRYVLLSPEEWVRQHLIYYFKDYLGYPVGLIAVEFTIKLFGLTKRCDILVHDRTGKPLLLVECKAPGVKVDSLVLEQAVQYNMKLQLPYLVITNGLDHYCCKIDIAEGTWSFLQKIPAFQDII